MNDNPLKFSLIIPAWPDEGRPFGLDFIDQLDWPRENLEVLIARGYSPCKQRNHAARQANGDILIFFDNDSCPEPDYLKNLATHFADPEVAAVGGPNPGLPTKKFVPNLVEAVLTSRIAVLSKTKRYKSTRNSKGSGAFFRVIVKHFRQRSFELPCRVAATEPIGEVDGSSLVMNFICAREHSEIKSEGKGSFFSCRKL